MNRISNERNYWLHRISNSPEVSHILLEKYDLLSYGWSDVGIKKCPGDLGDTKDSFNAAFEEIYEKKYLVWRGRWFLWNFIKKMKFGDYVIVPAQKKFHVYEIVDDIPFAVRDFPDKDLKNLKDSDGNAITKNSEGLLWREGRKTHFDLGFFRRVRKIQRNIPRYEYADAALTSRMKYMGSNVNCKDVGESIERAIRSYSENKPINLHNLILAEHQGNTLNILKTNLNPDKFEKLVAWYFQKLGAKTDIPPKNESDKMGDADVLATFESIRIMICIQVKFHDEKTGKWGAIQIEKYSSQLDDDMRDESSKDRDNEIDFIIKWLVSTADDFTSPCKDKAKECKIRLVNGKEFAKMLLEVGVSDLSDFENA